MRGGGHLLGVGGVLAAAQAFDLGDAARGHDDAAPAAAGEFEHGSDQAQGAGLAGEAADHLGATAKARVNVRRSVIGTGKLGGVPQRIRR
jgi:hypothetical protein